MDLWKLASTLWSVACQALTSLRFPRQEHWGELPFLSPGDLRDPGIELVSLALAGGFFTAEPPGRPSSFIRSTFIGHFSANRHGHRHQETRDREEGSPGWGRGSLNPAWRPTQVFIEGLQGGSLQNWALKEPLCLGRRHGASIAGAGGL